MTFQELLHYLRADSLTEREKGAKFEKLMRAWLKTDPRYKADLTDVWLWEDFPSRSEFGGADLGIDLVARTDLGLYWAIQCKFYAEDATIDKSAVDSFISNSSRLFTDPVTGDKDKGFVSCVWISTTEKWGSNAEESIRNQRIYFTRIGLSTFEESVVDWEALLHGNKQEIATKEPMPHQCEAMEKAHEYFADHDRGKLIMACGTGKTYTSLAIVEQETAGKGIVLFMVPSIALLGQSLNAWMADTKYPMKAICICSDSKASRSSNTDDMENSVIDLARPASTNSKSIAKQFEQYKDFDGLLVVFSTYQSIDAVAEAQKEIQKSLGDASIFDWIVCDEAHRTTGIKIAGSDESAFTKIHNNTIIKGHRRLYMTATPRLYGDTIKAKAKENDHILCSMDDKGMYGEEFYRVGFSYAVTNGLLTDYKVLVLTVGSEIDLPENIKKQQQDPNNKELDFDMATRLIGCINGLSKNIVGDNKITWDADPVIMRRALVFCPNIKKSGDTSSSTNTAKQLPILAKDYWDSLPPEKQTTTVRIEAEHIDGTMNSQVRSQKLSWLKAEAADPNECRILCNVRCLSEGVDVPALDAVLFLSAKNSQVDVVQSVGRVMRNFRKGQPGEKKYGYIIIPVVVPQNVTPEEALSNNKNFAVIWSILNALRSHDDSFNALVNKINLNKEQSPKITVGTVPPMGDSTLSLQEKEEYAKIYGDMIARQLSFMEELKTGIYARMVEKVGDRLYWEKWANDVGIVAHILIARIKELIATSGKHQNEFRDFVTALQDNINSAITDEQSIEMIAQHLITRPVFEALFTEYNFAQNNPVCRSMEKMIDSLIEIGMEKDTAVLRSFYDSVRMNVGEIDNLEGKQEIIKNLYEKFFKGAFPKTVDQLGIVYTPVECVDFILHSVNAVLKKEFDCSLSDENIHVLDPFTGTGTFITRLLQSGLIRPEDMERKYLHEIHCNELVLLAYYVADVNIESVFHDVTERKDYLRYDNICLTDTFELAEKQENVLYQAFKDNSECIGKQRKLPIRVIVGNPPYSAKQGAANDNAQNLKYLTLDKRIEETYVANSSAALRTSLYDSYIRAFRWASDRVRKNNEGGIIGFITNGGWFDGNAASGFRKCLEQEFSSIYVLHLRGDQRTSGELSRREGGKIFGAGSRAPVVITILAYNPEHKGKANIYYHDIGDYLKREDKLGKIKAFRSLLSKDMVWQQLTPNEHGDWINQRSDLFGSFIVLGDKKDKDNKKTFFEDWYSRGVATSRDAWCYNFSSKSLENNISESIKFYNDQCILVKNGGDFIYDSKQFSWDRQQRKDVTLNKKYTFLSSNMFQGQYRPFVKKWVYFSRQLNNCVYQIPQFFPSSSLQNKVICVDGIGGKKDFSVAITTDIPDVQLMQNGQCFPLYWYSENKNAQASLFGDTTNDYTRHDGVTDWILKTIRGRFQNTREITKERIFYYVYGILHSPDYRARFNADLKKSLPRIPIVETIEDFMDFAMKGKELAELHLNYEDIPAHPDVIVTGDAAAGNFHVEKMRFVKKGEKATIIYNSHIKIENIPLEAYEYVVNGRSAIEWIMERYQISTDKDSGIVNDPNNWAEEHDKPRYILDLLLSVINVSTQTLAIVESLPKLDFEEESV